MTETTKQTTVDLVLKAPWENDYIAKIAELENIVKCLRRDFEIAVRYLREENRELLKALEDCENELSTAAILESGTPTRNVIENARIAISKARGKQSWRMD